jgi:hypothetical protein
MSTTKTSYAIKSGYYFLFHSLSRLSMKVHLKYKNKMILIKYSRPIGMFPATHRLRTTAIVHICPHSLQHVPVYGCHSGDDALSQFLKIIWQGWYVTGASIPKRVRHSRCTVVTELVFANCRIHLLLWSRHFATRSPLTAAARNAFPRQLQTNLESFPNSCISRDCRLTGYFIINMWKCYLLFELPCITS